MKPMTEIHDADLPCQGVAWVQTLAIRDRNQADFQRISNKQTLNGAHRCGTPHNPRPTESHEQANSGKTGHK